MLFIGGRYLQRPTIKLNDKSVAKRKGINLTLSNSFPSQTPSKLQKRVTAHEISTSTKSICKKTDP
jgi:hypothetical protein